MKLTDCSRQLMCVAVVALGCVAVPLFAQQGPFGLVPTWGLSWALHGSMPFERSETAAVEINGKIYVIAGNSRGNEANSLLQINPATGAWRERALMPSVASHAGAAALSGRIYVVGGSWPTFTSERSTAFLQYRPCRRSLAGGGAAVGAKRVPGVVALNGRLHAIGGRDPQQKTVAMHEVYDPATDSWRTAAPLPQARDHLGIAVVGRANPRPRRTHRSDRRQHRTPRRVRPGDGPVDERRAAPDAAECGRDLRARRPHRLCRWRVPGRAGQDHLYRSRSLQSIGGRLDAQRSADRPLHSSEPGAQPRPAHRRSRGRPRVSFRR